LIDQGTGDEFLEKELLSDHFQRACADVAMPLNLRMQKVRTEELLQSAFHIKFVTFFIAFSV